MKPIVRFDESLPVLARVIAEELGEGVLESGVALRDITGRLAFFVSSELEPAVLERVSIRLCDSLGGYARTDRAIADSRDFSTPRLLKESNAIQLLVDEKYRVRLVDRRIVGMDWLRAPSPPASGPPRFVFASLKGGVGRTTALSVVAIHLASEGKRVLAIDLDLEAPGLGWILLSSEALPAYGILDALVENGISGLDTAFLADMVGSSTLANQVGKIDVVPAFGSHSLRNPADVLAKIARGYSEDVASDGTTAGILDQLKTIVSLLAEPSRYDIVLIDARAGLHETTASSVLGLGADVFLFGVNEPQTFGGYSILLAHMSRFIDKSGAMPEWADRLTMVQGKAPLDASEREQFYEKSKELFEKAGFTSGRSLKNEFSYVSSSSFADLTWNDDVPDSEVFDEDWHIRKPIAVLQDTRFHGFDPLLRGDLITRDVYRTTFGELIDRIDEALRAAAEGDV